MDNETILKQFEEIEQKVEKLLGIRKSLEADNSELKNTIDTLKRELQGKVEAENDYNKERTLIRSKVDDLLVKLEHIDGP